MILVEYLYIISPYLVLTDVRMYGCTDVLTLEPNPNKLSSYCTVAGTISYFMLF